MDISAMGYVCNAKTIKTSTGKEFVSFQLSCNNGKDPKTGEKKKRVYLQCKSWEPNSAIKNDAYVSVTGRLQVGSYKNKEGLDVTSFDVTVKDCVVPDSAPKPEAAEKDPWD